MTDQNKAALEAFEQFVTAMKIKDSHDGGWSEKLNLIRTALSNAPEGLTVDRAVSKACDIVHWNGYGTEEMKTAENYIRCLIGLKITGDKE